MMITYGLYMSRDADIPGSARIVAGADTAVALIAGLAIFPIVFASPVLTQAVLQEDPGLGLLFQTVPLAFAEMPFGGLFAILFFLMTTFAALTSSIALLEVAVAWWDGDVTVPAERRRRRRAIGAVVLGSLAFLIGVGNALSQVPASAQDTFFNTWVPLGGVAIFEGETFLDAIDTLTADLMLPLGGVLTAIFAGWVMSATASREELQFKSERSFSFWRFLVRWVAPVVVLSILLYGTVIGPMLAGSEDEVSEAAQVIEEMSTPDE
jgi:NSS family neurotransmitter:Na+ symporter